jgi:hypothetical protein
MCIYPLRLAAWSIAAFLVMVRSELVVVLDRRKAFLRASMNGNRPPVPQPLVVNEVFDGRLFDRRCSSLPDFRARDMMLPPNAERASRLEGTAYVEIDR